MKFLKFSRKQTECGYEILKFLGARSFVLQRAAEFLNFMPAPSHNGFRILKFTSVPRNRFKILKFTLAPHKFKPAPAVRLNFALNSIPPARASKFENGVKFKGTAKFERGAR